MKSLEALGKYNIHFKVLNTREHGIPQNRQRLYFVGINKSVDEGTFQWPEPVLHRPLEDFLEPRKGRPSKSDLPRKSHGTAHNNVKIAIRELEQKGHKPLDEAWVIDCDSTYKFMSYQKVYSLCLTTSRSRGHWISNRGRYMTQSEMLGFQCMWKPEDGFKIVVSPRQLGNQIGNAMSVNVLERIFVRALPAAGLVPATRLHDRWEAAARTVKRSAAPSTPTSQRKRARSESPVVFKRAYRRKQIGAPVAKVARKSQA